MELHSRSAYILKCVMESEHGIPIKDILKKLSITKRTFYYDLGKIVEWMEENQFGAIEIQSQVLVVISERISEIKRELEKNEEYFFSIEERRTLEILFIALSPGVVTIERIQNLFDVSKNTVLADIRKWKEQLEADNMSLISTIQIGYYIIGEEFSIRKLISKQLQLLENLHPRTMIKNQLQKSLEELNGQEYDYKEIARCMIKQYVKDVEIKPVSDDIEYECMMIMASWIRSIKGYVFYVNEDEREIIMGTGSYRSLRRSIKNLRQYSLDIPENEVYYITTLLLGIKTEEFSSQEAENLFVYRFTSLLIRNYERIACVNLNNRERLSNRLRCHIRPLYYRLKYGLQSTNPLSEDVKKRYAETYEFTKRALREINSEVSLMITEEELAYLVIYFVSNEKDRADEEFRFLERPKILIVCGEGMATSILIKEKLEEMMGEIFQYELSAASAVKEEFLNQYVLIISTAYIENLKDRENVFFTTPILNKREKEYIIRFISEHGITTKYDKLIQKIMQTVEKDVVGKIDSTQLYFDLLHIFHEKQNSEKVKEHFMEYIKEFKPTPNLIYENWRDVVKEGCDRLFSGKEANHLFERMMSILSNKTLNMYKLKQDVILIHCPMQGILNGEIRSSIVVSKEPVCFLNDMEGQVFIFFSTIDNHTHFKILKELYDYIDCEEGTRLIEKLMEGEA